MYEDIVPIRYMWLLALYHMNSFFCCDIAILLCITYIRIYNYNVRNRIVIFVLFFGNLLVNVFDRIS